MFELTTGHIKCSVLNSPLLSAAHTNWLGLTIMCWTCYSNEKIILFITTFQTYIEHPICVCVCIKKTTAIIFSTSSPNVFIFIIIIRSYFVRPGCKTSHPSLYTEYTIHGTLIFIYREVLASCETFSINSYAIYLFFKSDYVCCYLIINDIFLWLSKWQYLTFNQCSSRPIKGVWSLLK